MSFQQPPGPPPGGPPPGGAAPPGALPPGGAPPPGGGFGNGPGYPPPGATPPGQGYPPPPMGPKRRPIPIQQSGVISERNGLVVVLLSLFTCFIYYFFWQYNTGKELATALGDDEIKPGQDLALTLITCTLWSIYVEYRNAQKVHAALLSRDPYAKDQSEMILICNVASLFVAGATWPIATYLLQEDLNKLARY